MSNTSQVLALLALVFVSSAQGAGLNLSSYFSDHMVLQRDRSILVWGEGDPGAEVEVKVASASGKGTAGADGRWQVKLDPSPAGGPFQMKVTSAGKTVTLEDVLFGDVWLCSGQSNMQMTLKECDDGPAVAKGAGELTRLRLCSMGRGWKDKPQTSADIKWRVATPDTAANFSAIGYYFASELLKDPAVASVPIGVIDSSFGGSACEAWIPAEALAKLDPKQLRDSMFGIKPAMLYNAMIAPLGPSGLKGVVWYQGESNADRPQAYAQVLSTMIAEWRRQFENPDLSFVIVGLPDWAQRSNGHYWSWLREAQARTVETTPHSSLAIGINTTDGFDLHPKQKHELGRRVALLAKRDVYGQKIIANGPVFKSAEVDGSAIRVTFNTADDGLVAAGGVVRGFALAGADGQYTFASGTIDGDSVVVRSDRVPTPKTVRYAWAGIPESTLTNKSGLPAAPFRTDQLQQDDVEVQHQPAGRHVVTTTYEVTISAEGQVTSLGVRGKQFLSNALGAAGGTSIPVFFGGKSLAKIETIGPDLLSCSDEQVSLQMAFKPDRMEWTLKNRGKDALNFRVSLAAQVAVTPGEVIKLQRGKSALEVAGIEKIENGEDGKMLQLSMKGGEEKKVVLTVAP